MTVLNHLTLAQAKKGLAAKEFTATELTDAHIAAVEKVRPLNIFITETLEAARAAALASDARLQKGDARPLEGLPIANKDLYCTAGTLTTAGSHILDGFVPPYESTVTQKLKDAGTISLGKVNLDEFAMGSANITSYHGPVISPWTQSNGNPVDASRKLVPGGSSGGSAAAVAARCALAATGTDTGGSIRQPAAFTGIAGIKPTYGRCSRFGIIAFASSLDQAGPMARTVEDCALMLQQMAGFDDKDSTSVDIAVPDYTKVLTGSVKGLKIGIPKEYRVDGTPTEIIDMWSKGAELLKEMGAQIVEVSLPHTKYALETYYIIAPAECSSNLSRYDGVKYGLRVPGNNLAEQYENTRGEGFGKEVRRRILVGTYVLSAGYYDAYYIRAQKVRARIAEDFRNAFEKCDLLLTPTAPSAAFAIGENEDDPIKMYLNDIFTIPTSLAGLPGMSIPGGMSKDGLPLGLQLIGRAFDEETILRTAHAMEQALALSPVPPLAA